MIIEWASGMTLDAFMKAHIFQPLGMNRTCFRSAHVQDRQVERYLSTVVPHRAGMYAWENDQLLNLDYLYGNRVPLTAAGLNASVTDMAKFDAALGTGKLLKPASLVEMWTPVRLNSGEKVGYGLGWNLDSYLGHRYVGHQG